VDIDKVEFSPPRKKSKHRITPSLLIPSEAAIDSSHVGMVNPVKNLLSSFTRMAEVKEVDVDNDTSSAAPFEKLDSREQERALDDVSQTVLTDQDVGADNQVDNVVLHVGSINYKGKDSNNAFSSMKSPSVSMLKHKAKASSKASSKSHKKPSKPVTMQRLQPTLTTMDPAVQSTDDIDGRLSILTQGSASKRPIEKIQDPHADTSRVGTHRERITSYLVPEKNTVSCGATDVVPSPSTVVVPSPSTIVDVECDVVFIDD